MSFLIQLFFHPEAWYHAHQLLAGQLGVDGLLALSLWLTLYSGQLTLANAGFMAIGAYTSVILAGGTTNAGRAVPGLELPFPLAAASGMLLAAAVAVAIGLAVLRLRGVFLAIATIGFGEALRFGVILNLGITGKGEGLNNPHAALTSGIGPIWLSLLVLAYAGWRLTGTKTGVAWAAIREDEAAAAAQGIYVTRYKLLAFVLGAVVAAYAGALSAHLSFLVDNGDYSFSLAINILIWAVVGGVAFVVGPIVGAIALNILPEVLRFTQNYRNVVDGLILIVVVTFAPDGLFHRRRRRGPPLWWPARWWPAQPAQPAPQARPAQGAPTLVAGPLVARTAGPTGAAGPAGATGTPVSDPLLELRDVRKHFGGVKAVDDVSLSVASGQVSGLIGPNGAGKTTLVNLVTGQLWPDGGDILLGGEPIAGLPPHERAARGVARTFQTVRLYRSLTVLENVTTGMHLHRRFGGWSLVLPSRTPRPADAARQQEARRLLGLVGLQVALAHRLAGTLSYGNQRRLEIARALALQPRLLLLDEPAAGLNPQEKAQLRDLLAELRAAGLTVVLVDHDLELVLGVCDQVTVLNFGRRIATGPPAQVATDEAVITAYLGTGRQAAAEGAPASRVAAPTQTALAATTPSPPAATPSPPAAAPTQTAPAAAQATLAATTPSPPAAVSVAGWLVVEHLAVAYGPVVAVSDVSFEIAKGEIVSLIGANGAGKSTVLNALSGVLRPRSGTARLGRLDLTQARPDAIVRAGLVQIPEGREILARLTVEENLLLGGWTRPDPEEVRADLDEMMTRFPILGQRRRLPAGALSGGEQQMLAIARGLLARPRLLLLDEPSLGLAPRAVEEVFTLIEAIRGQGITVLLVEQNARRALELADRAYVVETGRTVMSGTGMELQNDPSVRRAYLGRT